MSASRNDEALCKSEPSVTISCGMPGPEAISGYYPVSTPMKSIHCLDWEAVSSFCFHWWRSPINSSHQLACLPSRRMEALRLCLTFKLSSVNSLISWPRIFFSKKSKEYGFMYLVRKLWEAVSISQGLCRIKSILHWVILEEFNCLYEGFDNFRNANKGGTIPRG